MSSLLAQVKRWFNPLADGATILNEDDGTAHLIEIGRLRARIHDLGSTIDLAGMPLQQLQAFEERLEQLRGLRVDRLQPGELIETQLHALERDLKASVIKRFRQITAYLELHCGKPNQRTQDALSSLTKQNEQSLTQLEEAIHHLIMLDQGDQDDAISQEFDLLNDVLKGLTEEHK